MGVVSAGPKLRLTAESPLLAEGTQQPQSVRKAVHKAVLKAVRTGRGPASPGAALSTPPRAPGPAPRSRPRPALPAPPRSPLPRPALRAARGRTRPCLHLRGSKLRAREPDGGSGRDTPAAKPPSARR